MWIFLLGCFWAIRFFGASAYRAGCHILFQLQLISFSLERQAKHYSGKKKRHTVKNQILVSPRTRKILHVSKTVEGKRHDKKIAEEDPIWHKFPPGSLCIGDSGYQGLDETNSRVKVVTPKKKPKGKELTESEKKNNTSISSIRTPVEHPFAWMKHFYILKNQFRGRVTQADIPFRTIAALYNFNLAYR